MDHIAVSLILTVIFRVVLDFLISSTHLHTNGWYLLDVSVDVQPVVFGGQHDGSVVHQADVEALGMFDFRL